ncbi:iron-containing alcohol dehydrogenase [soil metagenome]
MKFEFATATRIIFGEGVLQEIGPLAATLGARAFVVGGSTRARLMPLLTLLQAQDIATTIFSVPGEPTIELVLAGVQQARAAQCDLVIGMGGGSALDTGKAIAALLTNPGDPLDYLEVIGRGQPLLAPSAPYIAIPTTAGTGAEVTRNAVLAAPDQQVKVSLRSPFMLPRIALVDPVLTYNLSPALTASTGLDALTQCLEPYVSNQANPLTDGLCREGLQRSARSLRRAFDDGEDRAARADMAIASLCGGLALANAKLGAVHGFAAPLGGMFPAPHGVICARLLPLVMAANVCALQERAPASPILARYAEVAQILTGDAKADAAAGLLWVQELCAALAIPPLANFGVTQADIPAVVAKAQKASSMQGNPIVLTGEELTQILQRAI